MTIRKIISIIVLVFLYLITLACSFSFNAGSDSATEETLQAIYLQQTMDAMEAESAPAEESAAEPTVTIEITHTTIPGTPGWVSQWWMDTDSSSTAGQKRANGGDNLSLNLLERPFTAQEMKYRPDTDLHRVEVSHDDNFYYFMLDLEGVNPDTGMLSAYYGVELDIDKDSRGDLLVWGLGEGSTDWNISNMYVLSDDNNDVGATRPMRADAPSSSLDGYERVILSPTQFTDPDAGWKRVDPANSSVVQIAVKKSVMNNVSAFMWSAWADDGQKDAASFDYNDKYTLAEAGSPIGGASDYPLKEIYLADNTCRLAYGYEPTGEEPGLCQVAPPEPTARPTDEPPPTPPCECPINQSYIDDPECCEYCGYTWSGTQEFPCY